MPEYGCQLCLCGQSCVYTDLFFFGSGRVLGLINLLTDKEDGGIGVLDLAGWSSRYGDSGLFQVRPGMFSGSSSTFISMPSVNDGLLSMIV